MTSGYPHSVEYITTRLKSALKIKTDTELARLMNISTSVLGNWKSRNSLDHEVVITLCEKHHIDLNWLYLTNREKEAHPIAAAERKVEYGNRTGLPLIPIDAMAGIGNGDMPALSLDSERYIIPEFNQKADFLIRISGTSMSPKYFNGDIVACKKIPTKIFLQWGKVYIMDTIQGALCKRVLPSETQGNIVCRSENREIYPDFEMPWKEIRSLAIVVGVVRLE